MVEYLFFHINKYIFIIFKGKKNVFWNVTMYQGELVVKVDQFCL